MESLQAGREKARQLFDALWTYPALSVTDEQKQNLFDYLDLLNHWNRVHSLTAIESAEDQVKKHLLDALCAWAAVDERYGRNRTLSVADIGSGMGVPGIVWAIVMPESRFDLIERQGKKAAFLTHVAGRLGLSARVRVLASDVRDVKPLSPYDLIVSRAFAVLDEFVRCSQHLAGLSTEWAAMMGKPPQNMNKETSEDLLLKKMGKKIIQIRPISVPGLLAVRSLVWVGQAQ